MGILISTHFIISYEVPCPLSFLGKVFGRLRLLGVFLSLFGPPCGIRFLQVNLQGRGFDFVDWCVMCHCNGETVDHLLLHCGKAYWLWSLVFRSFGISWVLPRSIANWRNWFGKHSSSIWNLVLLCLMGCIWRE